MYKTEQERELARKESVTKYNISAKRKASRNNYEFSDKGKEIRREHKNTELFKNRVKRYRQTLEYKTNKAKADTRYRTKHKIEINARAITRQAVISGEIIKTPCCICGNTKSEAHHLDYAIPLLIIWVCSFHHKQIHL